MQNVLSFNSAHVVPFLKASAKLERAFVNGQTRIIWFHPEGQKTAASVMVGSDSKEYEELEELVVKVFYKELRPCGMPDFMWDSFIYSLLNNLIKV